MKYTVKRGDSLSKIAKAYGLPTEKVIRANSQITNPNLIEVGDQINIPTLEDSKAKAKPTANLASKPKAKKKSFWETATGFIESADTKGKGKGKGALPAATEPETNKKKTFRSYISTPLGGPDAMWMLNSPVGTKAREEEMQIIDNTAKALGGFIGGAVLSLALPVVAGPLFTGMAINNLAGEDGVKKTVKLAKEGKTDEAVWSGLGDLGNLAMLAPIAANATRFIKNAKGIVRPSYTEIPAGQAANMKGARSQYVATDPAPEFAQRAAKRSPQLTTERGDEVTFTRYDYYPREVQSQGTRSYNYTLGPKVKLGAGHKAGKSSGNLMYLYGIANGGGVGAQQTVMGPRGYSEQFKMLRMLPTSVIIPFSPESSPEIYNRAQLERRETMSDYIRAMRLKPGDTFRWNNRTIKYIPGKISYDPRMLGDTRIITDRTVLNPSTRAIGTISSDTAYIPTRKVVRPTTRYRAGSDTTITSIPVITGLLNSNLPESTDGYIIVPEGTTLNQ